MNEFIFLLFLVLLTLVIKRGFLFKISLSGIFFLGIALALELKLNIFSPWIAVYVTVFVLEHLTQNILFLEMENLKLEYKAGEKDFAKSEKKLSEMEGFNRELQLEVTKITKFYEISKTLTGVMYLQQLPPLLANIVREGFELKSLGLLIFENGKQHGIFIYPDKNIIDFKENIEAPLIDEEKIISEEEAGFYDGEVLEPMFLRLGYLTSKEKTYIIPLISEGKMNALLIFEDLKEEKIDLAHSFAGFLSLTLHKSKLYEKVQELAITDELTQVYVRRHFLKIYKEELSRIRERKGEACFLMLDLDRFKNCNDTFGHLVGDVVLKETAKLIKQNIREVDLVGRYGGEEFGVFLPETKLEDGIYVAQRIRKAIERDTLRAYDEVLNITVSIGVASYPSDAREALELIEKADLALYYAKRKGRNRVIAYSRIK